MKKRFIYSVSFAAVLALTAAAAAAATAAAAILAGCGGKGPASVEKYAGRSSDLVVVGRIKQHYPHVEEGLAPTTRAVIIEIVKVKKGRAARSEKFDRNHLVYLVERPDELFAGWDIPLVGSTFVFYITRETPRPTILFADPVTPEAGD